MSTRPVPSATWPLVLAALFASVAGAGESPPTVEEEAPAAHEEAPATPAEPVDETLAPRERYNRGLTQLAAEDFATAADTFLAARDDAGPDPQLRYRAAFNLGYALAQSVGEDAEPAEAIETLRQAAAWFNDAVRLAPPEDDDARVNLELVSRRILQLADQLNADDRLTAALDRLIDDQRGVRDRLRGLLTDIGQAGADAEPLGFKPEFDGLASRERALLAEVGDSVDLAAEERLFIEQLPDAERTPEQQGRAHQLAAAADYLERARQSLSDTRRRLRRLEGERAHRRADAALAELKRAREQLLDPVQVLQAVLRDEVELTAHSAALASLTATEAETEPPPAWLTAAHLRERQEQIGARTGGVLGQFDAVAAQAGNVPATDTSPDGERTLQAIAEATPPLEDALAAMRNAIAALGEQDAAAAVPEQQRASAGLRTAIELFASLRGLIELAYGGQQSIVALLAPDSEAGAGLGAAERAEALHAQTSANQRRLQRLEGLLQEERSAAAQEPPSVDADDAAAANEQAQQAQEAAEARYQQAEALRVRALAGLDALAGQMPALAEGSTPAAAQEAANETLAALEALRQLYFSIVEHLQALRQEQAETHDQTATVQFEASTDASEAVVAQLAPAAQRQAEHGQMADALAAALAQQADAAAASGAADGGEADGAATAGQRFAEAAGEVRQASGRMATAQAVLAEAAARAGAMSPELEPALADQQAALDHLDTAIAALAPPESEQDNQSGQDQAGAEQPQPQQNPGADEAMSQRQALKRLQAIRDREAQRQRNRGASERAPVEKDW